MNNIVEYYLSKGGGLQNQLVCTSEVNDVETVLNIAACIVTDPSIFNCLITDHRTKLERLISKVIFLAEIDEKVNELYNKFKCASISTHCIYFKDRDKAIPLMSSNSKWLRENICLFHFSKKAQENTSLYQLLSTLDDYQDISKTELMRLALQLHEGNPDLFYEINELVKALCHSKFEWVKKNSGLFKQLKIKAKSGERIISLLSMIEDEGKRTEMLKGLVQFSQAIRKPSFLTVGEGSSVGHIMEMFKEYAKLDPEHQKRVILLIMRWEKDVLPPLSLVRAAAGLSEATFQRIIHNAPSSGLSSPWTCNTEVLEKTHDLKDEELKHVLQVMPVLFILSEFDLPLASLKIVPVDWYLSAKEELERLKSSGIELKIGDPNGFFCKLLAREDKDKVLYLALQRKIFSKKETESLFGERGRGKDRQSVVDALVNLPPENIDWLYNSIDELERFRHELNILDPDGIFSALLKKEGNHRLAYLELLQFNHFYRNIAYLILALAPEKASLLRDFLRKEGFEEGKTIMPEAMITLLLAYHLLSPSTLGNYNFQGEDDPLDLLLTGPDKEEVSKEIAINVMTIKQETLKEIVDVVKDHSPLNKVLSTVSGLDCFFFDCSLFDAEGIFQ